MGSHELLLRKIFTLEPLAALGLAPNCRVGGGDMEFEKARARHSIGNTQSVLIVKAKICGLTGREHDRLPIHDKLQRAFKYDEHAFRIGMVMQAGGTFPGTLSTISHEPPKCPLLAQSGHAGFS